MITRRQMILGLLSAGGASLCPGLLKAGGNTLLGAMSGWVFEPDRLRALLAASERILPGVVAAGFENYVNYWLVREPFNRAADWKPLAPGSYLPQEIQARLRRLQDRAAR